MVDNIDFFGSQPVPCCHIGQLNTIILEGILVQGIERCLILDNQLIGDGVGGIVATICLFRKIGQGDV